MEGIAWRRHTNVRRTIGPFLRRGIDRIQTGDWWVLHEKNIGFARQRADREPSPPPDEKIAETHNNSRG